MLFLFTRSKSVCSVLCFRCACPYPCKVPPESVSLLLWLCPCCVCAVPLKCFYRVWHCSCRVVAMALPLPWLYSVVAMSCLCLALCMPLCCDFAVAGPCRCWCLLWLCFCGVLAVCLPSVCNVVAFVVTVSLLWVGPYCVSSESLQCTLLCFCGLAIPLPAPPPTSGKLRKSTCALAATSPALKDKEQTPAHHRLWHVGDVLQLVVMS